MARASSSRPLPCLNGFRSGPASDLEKLPRHGLAAPAGVAADEDMRINGLGSVAQDHGPGRDTARAGSLLSLLFLRSFSILPWRLFRCRPRLPASAWSVFRASLPRPGGSAAGLSRRARSSWRRRRRGNSSPRSGSGHTCGRGSAAQAIVNPSRPRPIRSMRSSMISFWSLRKRRPTVRKPMAARGPGSPLRSS